MTVDSIDIFNIHFVFNEEWDCYCDKELILLYDKIKSKSDEKEKVCL